MAIQPPRQQKAPPAAAPTTTPAAKPKSKITLAGIGRGFALLWDEWKRIGWPGVKRMFARLWAWWLRSGWPLVKRFLGWLMGRLGRLLTLLTAALLALIRLMFSGPGMIAISLSLLYWGFLLLAYYNYQDLYFTILRFFAGLQNPPFVAYIFIFLFFIAFGHKKMRDVGDGKVQVFTAAFLAVVGWQIIVHLGAFLAPVLVLGLLGTLATMVPKPPKK